MPQETYIHALRQGLPDAPTLFLFHGTGGDEHQLLPLGRQLLPQATLVSPRGDVAEMGAARFFRRTGEGVYDMDDLARATARMSGFVGGHARGGSKVLGLGYSNGANILASMLFAAPDLFDAVVLMHPLIPFEPRIAGDLAGRRILITAGRRDPICPSPLTLQLEACLRDAGGAVTIEWHEGGHELRQNEMVAAKAFFRDAGAEAAA